MHCTTHVREKWQLLSTKIIKARHNPRGIDTYQLYLFGVLFLLKLIRQNDVNSLRHRLYNNDKSFLEYFDIIADNYRHAIVRCIRDDIGAKSGFKPNTIT
jgi:hypothetical protein